MNRERRAEFFDIFLRSAGPSPELLGAFACGLLVVGILSNAFFEFLNGSLGLNAIAGTLIASAALIALAYVLYRRDRRRRPVIRADVDESRLAPAYDGLILLLGPGKFEHLAFAVAHHSNHGGGKQCWVVMQDQSIVRNTYTEFDKALQAEGLKTQLHPLYIQQLNARDTYEVVRAVFDREAAEHGLTSNQVIADITGGTKPLTAGMVLAAITSGGAMEYVESDRDDQGQPIPSTLRVVLIDTEFYLAHSLPDIFERRERG